MKLPPFLSITCLLLLLSTSGLAVTHISGPIGGKTFLADDSPFIIESDITVQKGQTTTIKEGCIFLFKPFAGLIVNGKIEVLGSTEKRCVFTSVNDANFNPSSEQTAAPFDWNGIAIEPTCDRALFRNTNVAYTVYGIKSKLPGVVLYNCIFSQNGQFHFTLSGKTLEVHDNLPYSYNVKQEEDALRWEQERQKAEADALIHAKTIKIVRLSSAIFLATAGVATGTAGGYFASQSSLWNSRYSDTSWAGSDVKKQKEASSLSLSNKNAAIAYLCAAGVSIPTSIILFIIHPEKKVQPKLASINVGGNLALGKVTVRMCLVF